MRAALVTPPRTLKPDVVEAHARGTDQRALVKFAIAEEHLAVRYFMETS